MHFTNILYIIRQKERLTSKLAASLLTICRVGAIVRLSLPCNMLIMVDMLLEYQEYHLYKHCHSTHHRLAKIL